MYLVFIMLESFLHVVVIVDILTPINYCFNFQITIT